MIYLITKWHKVEAGETASSEKIEKADATTAYESALSKCFEYSKNYMDDKSVLAWKVSVIQPSDMTIKKVEGYARPIVEEPTEEVASAE